MAGYSNYKKSTNPFEDDDIDDELFLKNSRRTVINNGQGPRGGVQDQIQSLHQKKQEIEDRTLNSTTRSISLLRDSEQVGIATAEELARQREKLEKTDKQLDEINATLRFSQKHINGIKSVFSSLKNYMSGKTDSSPSASPSSSGTSQQVKPSVSNNDLQEKLQTYDRYENHPSTRLRGESSNYSNQNQSQLPASKDFSARLDANLQEMCSNITRLKGLATDLSGEIDSQNDLIEGIIGKADTADLTITRQNKDMMRILKK